MNVAPLTQCHRYYMNAWKRWKMLPMIMRRTWEWQRISYKLNLTLTQRKLSWTVRLFDDKLLISSRLTLRTLILILDIRLDFSKGYYQTLLDLADCYIGNKIDSSAFEECSRYIFGLKSYVISTIDKILYALCHQAYVISTDERCQGLIELYMKDDHTIAQTDINQLQAYQLQAEAFIKGNENMYRLLFAVWLSKLNRLPSYATLTRVFLFCLGWSK